MSDPVTLLCWRNWAAEYGEIDASISGASGWESEAPADDMLTPRPGEIAIHDGTAGARVWRVNIGADGSASSENAVGRPVGIVALVNVNIVLDPADASLITVRAIDQNGGEVECAARAVTTHGGNNGFSRTTLLFIIDRDGTGSGDLDRIVAIDFEVAADVQCGIRDPWTSAISAAALFNGTVVAGPVWRPRNGLKLFGHSPGVGDRSPSVTSIGGTDWTSPLARPRLIAGELALLSEAEVEADPPDLGLRQLAEWCGTSRPLLLIPDTRDDQLMHKQVVYGMLTEPVTWVSADKISEDGVCQIGFRATLSVREAR